LATAESKNKGILPFLYLYLMLQTAVGLLPFAWMLKTAFASGEEFGKPMTVWRLFFPSSTTLANFRTVLLDAPILTWTINSLVIAILGTVLSVFLSALAGFAFAKMRFPGRDVLFWLIMATIMIPSQVTSVPRFIIFIRMGIFNSYQALILPGLANAMGIFLMRQFFKGIPDSLIEAARLDGASWFDIFWRIMLPLAKPAVVILVLVSFVGRWNNFMGPLIYTNTNAMYTLPVGIARFAMEYSRNPAALMAGATLVVLPCLAIFIIGQRYFTNGIAMSGMKY